MATLSIPLGSARSLVELFSYPNSPNSTEPLTQTIEHWIDQTLARDGYASKGASATVSISNGKCELHVDGPAGIEEYAKRLPVFLANGASALSTAKSLKKIKRKTPWPSWLPIEKKNKRSLWDPQNTGQWRFFLPLGMALNNQRALNFFHYPPIRLLNSMRDYLDDPVPVRLIELMKANGVKTEQEAWLFSTVMDAAPIAAPDDQGTIYKPGGSFSDAVHLLPIEYFHEYQRTQVNLLLNECNSHPDFTIPIVVYGTPARQTFAQLYPNKAFRGRSSSSPNTVPTNKAVTMSIINGKKTHVLGSGHPYAFYAQVQAEVGSGSVLPEKWNTAVQTMIKDLVVSRWQQKMANDPTQDANAVLTACEDYWNSKAQRKQVEALVLHQGSLLYPDPSSLAFHFSLSLQAAKARLASN